MSNSWNDSEVMKLVSGFADFLTAVAPELPPFLRSLAVFRFPEGDFPEGERFVARNDNKEVYVREDLREEQDDAFLAFLLHIIVGQALRARMPDISDDQIEFNSRMYELDIMRRSTEEQCWEFKPQRCQCRLAIDNLMVKLGIVFYPEAEEGFRIQEYLWAAYDKVDALRSEVSFQKKEAFANCLARLLVKSLSEMGLVFQCQSLRELVAFEKLSNGIWTFGSLFEELNRNDGWIFGPLTKLHFQLWDLDEVEGHDEDEEDFRVLQDWHASPPPGWRPS